MERGFHWRRGLLALAVSVSGHGAAVLFWHTKPLQAPALQAGRMSPGVGAEPVVTLRLVSADAEGAPPLAAPAQSVPLASPQVLPYSPVATGLVFVPSGRLDRPLVPMSAPDTSRLDGLHFSGLPIRLRLLIDASGQVIDVLTLMAATDDEDAVERIKAMLFATAYIPGRLNGVAVAAQLDLELQLDNGG